MSVYRYRYHRRIYYYFRVNINGKQFSRRLDKNRRFHSYEDALHAEYMFLFKNNLYTSKESDYVLTLTNDFLEYISNIYAPTTVYSFKKLWDRFYLPLLKGYRINELNESVFISINEVINKLPNQDKHVYVMVGKNFLRFLHKYNIVISENIFFSSSMKKEYKPKLITFWTNDEFIKFINVVDDIYFKLLFSILYYYGLRISELRGLRNDCFLHDKLIINSTITNKTLAKGQIISDTKSRSSNRTFPMLDHIWNLYLEFKESYYFNSDYLFYSTVNGSKVIGETTINRYLKMYIEKSGVKNIHLHSFRHSCASLLINSGMDSLQVAAWLGHSSPNVTLSTYSHLFDSRKNDVYTLLNNLGNKK